jgi:hypothetical protein
LLFAEPLHDHVRWFRITGRALDFPAPFSAKEQEPEHKNERWYDGQPDEERGEHHQDRSPVSCEPAHKSNEEGEPAAKAEVKEDEKKKA